MNALVFTALNEPQSYQTIDDPTPSNDAEVVVNLKAAALNHRDNWITKGMYRNVQFPSILGSDGAGEVVDAGTGAVREVIINPNCDWGDNPRFPSKAYHILGMDAPGTFAEKIVVNQDRLHDRPAHLSMEQAAALPLAGLTAYRALMVNCRVQAGEKVLISGVGGGVALFACQFAIAAGAEVYVTSSSTEKIEKAVAMGAAGGANYTVPTWSKQLKAQIGGVDVVIDSAGGAGFNDLIRLCNMGARIGIYGGTRGNYQNLSPQLLFFKQITIHGSTMGSDQEFADMVAFVSQHKIVPVVDSVYPIEQGNDAMAHMDQGKQFGKIVLTVAG
ncbi:MAG: zinc-binding dehydrogenase [Chloroflexota bacterium]